MTATDRVLEFIIHLNMLEIAANRANLYRPFS
jgi:hypothetical protein